LLRLCHDQLSKTRQMHRQSRCICRRACAKFTR
jgi:hypothetical protein